MVTFGKLYFNFTVIFTCKLKRGILIAGQTFQMAAESNWLGGFYFNREDGRLWKDSVLKAMVDLLIK